MSILTHRPRRLRKHEFNRSLIRENSLSVSDLIYPLFIIEGENKKGYVTGFTDNYVKVRMPWDPSLVNTLHNAMLDTIDEEGFVRICLL